MNEEKISLQQNISVRPIEMDDTLNVVKWRNNERVINNFLYRGEFNEETHKEWMRTKVASGEVRQFIIEEYDRPVGSVYFRDIDMENQTAEYGIFIGEDDGIGHGIGTAVAKWAVEYAQKEMNLKTLFLRVIADNVAAIKSYEKAGFVSYEIKPDFIDGRDLVFMKKDY